MCVCHREAVVGGVPQGGFVGVVCARARTRVFPREAVEPGHARIKDPLKWLKGHTQQTPACAQVTLWDSRVRVGVPQVQDKSPPHQLSAP